VNYQTLVLQHSALLLQQSVYISVIVYPLPICSAPLSYTNMSSHEVYVVIRVQVNIISSKDDVILLVMTIA